jgi:starvation-inducible outer membrane lipoprotein
VNGQLIADQNGMLENTKLAGELITEFC